MEEGTAEGLFHRPQPGSVLDAIPQILQEDERRGLYPVRWVQRQSRGIFTLSDQPTQLPLSRPARAGRGVRLMPSVPSQRRPALAATLA